MEPVQVKETRTKVIQTVTIAAVLILFYLALWALRREIKLNNLQDVLQYFEEISYSRFFTALAFSFGSYWALTFYDFLGLRHIKKTLSYGRVALTSFIAYTFSHNIGAAPITGGGIRYRLYSKWGLTAGESASVLVICGMTFWVGFLTMGAFFFFVKPPVLPPFQLPAMHFLFFHFQFDSTVFSNVIFGVGVFCLLGIAGYLLSALVFHRTIKIFKWHFPTPSVGIAMGQMAAGVLDWTCSGSVLYILLPPSDMTFTSFMSIYLSAQILGFLSQVPGGLGVLDWFILEALEPVLPATSIAGALLAFRVCYYLIPFILGLFSFTFYEVVRNRERVKRALRILDRFAPDFAPHLFSILIFLCGASLLISDATPEVSNRLVRLNELMPLGLMEGSHFMAALVGAALLVVARSLQQRLESAYTVALVLLGTGVLTCLFKGFDYKEALTLLVVFGALLICRRYFPRRTSIFQQRYSPMWVTAILFILLGSIWVGVFNYRYEDYSPDLWSTFDIVEDAARFLRATLGASATLFIFSIISLLSPTQPETEYPTSTQLAKALEVVKSSRRAPAMLALMGDKALFFNKRSEAFLMYAIEGKSWITLGDAVGDPKDRQDLAIRFKDQCHRKKAWALFYLVDQEQFQFYLDMGLTVLKIAEEARVPLKNFKVDALFSGDLKNAYQRFKDKEEFTFGILPPGEWRMLLPELRKISEDWLTKSKTREKAFSAGFYDEEYLRNFSLALVWKEGHVVAFANVLTTNHKDELAVDLLRSAVDSPAFLEDYLVLELMQWAREKGYKGFNLGCAPLLEVEETPLAPYKDQVAGILSPYAHATLLPEIRKDKERFNPEWVPKYLATSGTLPLNVALNNIRSLINKGHRG